MRNQKRSVRLIFNSKWSNNKKNLKQTWQVTNITNKKEAWNITNRKSVLPIENQWMPSDTVKNKALCLEKTKKNTRRKSQNPIYLLEMHPTTKTHKENSKLLPHQPSHHQNFSRTKEGWMLMKHQTYTYPLTITEKKLRRNCKRKMDDQQRRKK